MCFFNNDAFWNLVAIISSFIIVKITINAERKLSNKNLELQEKQQKEVSAKEEKLHNESIAIEREQARATLLPFLMLNQEIKLSKRNENYIFPLKITNYGNSIALDIKIKYDDIDNICFVYKERSFDTTQYYQYTGFLFDNVLPTNYSSEFEFLLDVCENRNHYLKLQEPFAGKIHFSILFKDALYNQYQQDYFILFSTTSGCCRVESYLPKLLKK